MMAFAVTAAADADNIAAAAGDTAAEDITAAEPSLYSTAYLSPKPVIVGPPSHNPYEGAVASTSTNIIRTPGNIGQVAAFHKTIETPFSSAHKADVRYINDVQPYQLASPYPYAAPVVHGPYAAPVVPGPYAAPVVPGSYPYAPTGTYPYATAGPYPYGAVSPVKAYGYNPSVVPPAYGYGSAVAPPAYGYGSSITPQAYGSAVTPQAYGYGSAVGPQAYGASVTPYGYGPVGAPTLSHASFSGPYGAHYSYKR